MVTKRYDEELPGHDLDHMKSVVVGDSDNPQEIVIYDDRTADGYISSAWAYNLSEWR